MALGREPGPDWRRWQGRISRMLNEGLSHINAWTQGSSSIAVNLFETDTCLEAVFALPALHKHEIEVTYEGDTLVVRGEKKHDIRGDRRYVHREWDYGPFYREVSLPTPIDFDRATASYDNGVLTVILPKAVSARTRKVEVTSEEAPMTSAGIGMAPTRTTATGAGTLPTATGVGATPTGTTLPGGAPPATTGSPPVEETIGFASTGTTEEQCPPDDVNPIGMTGYISGRPD